VTGDELRRLRQALGLTASELAAEAGVSVSTISAWETGMTLPAAATRRAVLRGLRRLYSRRRRAVERVGQVMGWKR
jgi:transcriptional regulator with XRE-family HTH domain